MLYFSTPLRSLPLCAHAATYERALCCYAAGYAVSLTRAAGYVARKRY